jgi:hypothetical protein
LRHVAEVEAPGAKGLVAQDGELGEDAGVRDDRQREEEPGPR